MNKQTSKDKITNAFCNLIKVKSLASILVIFCIVYCTINKIDIPKDIMTIFSAIIMSLVLRLKTKEK